jgi:glutamyl-tRNA reductase
MSFNYLGIALKNLVENPIQGINYCSPEELTSAKVAHEDFPFLLDSLKELEYIEEISLVSTCNRFEIYFFSTNPLKLIEQKQVQNIIQSINKTSIEMNYLSERDAELQFIRTYCGLNSGLVSEQEIIMQVQIAFRQSIAMEYLGKRGEYLLNFASKIRKQLDDETVFNGGFSYCNVAIEQAFRNLNIQNLSSKRIAVLGSGGTALKSVFALLKAGVNASNIKIIHRISSSSAQILAFKEIEGLKFMRAKNGYHVDRVKEAIYLADIVVFGIDSKLPVINLDSDLKNIILDFNSKSSCTFSLGYELGNYVSAQNLETMVRDFSEKNLNNEGFKSKIELAENYIRSLTADTLISKL